MSNFYDHSMPYLNAFIITAESCIFKWNGYLFFMNFTKKQLAAFNITCRVLIALLGGYLFSALSAVLIAQLLPGNEINNIIMGLMLSFIIYTVIVLFVFATKTALRAGVGVFIPCIVMYFFYHYFNGITA